jgi:EpsI family protein
MSEITNASPTVQPTAPQDPQTMRLLWKRAAILLAIMIPSAAFAGYIAMHNQHTHPMADVAAQAIPSTLTDPNDATHLWTGIDEKLTEDEMTILETRDYVSRSYLDGRGQPVDLCVIFSEDNRKGTHPPDVCLEGGGSRINYKAQRAVQLDEKTTLTMHEIVAEYSDRKMYVTYFYKCGTQYTGDFYTQQAMIVWDGLTGKNADGALVRYSTPLVNDDLDAARKRTDALIACTFPLIRDKLRTP